MKTDASALVQEIDALRKRREAVILAHVYTRPEIQDIADYVGDSLGLSQQAARTDRRDRMIVFCGVRFMAETAAILSPEKTVVVPDPEAGCPMADMVRPEDVLRLRGEHPDAMVACYVNSSVAVKAASDVCVTSSNAVKIVRRLPARTIIFVPDNSLGAWVHAQVPEKELVFWYGYCPTHHWMLRDHVLAAKAEHPDALVLAHPENTEALLECADFIGSTGQIQEHVRTSSAREFIIATENGILYRLGKDNPGKTFYPVSTLAVCPNMKMNTLEKVRDVLQTARNIVTVEPEVRTRALAAITRMLEMS